VLTTDRTLATLAAHLTYLSQELWVWPEAK